MSIYDADQIVARLGGEVVKGSRAHRLRKPAREPSLIALAWREYRAVVRTVTRGGAR